MCFGAHGKVLESRAEFSGILHLLSFHVASPVLVCPRLKVEGTQLYINPKNNENGALKCSAGEWPY